MQLAAPTLLLLAAVLPGLVFVNSYFAGKFPRELAPSNALDQLALYVTWAIPLDAVALHLTKPLTPEVHSALMQLLGLKAATPANETGPFPLMDVSSWWYPLMVYMAFIASCAVLAVLLRKLVWACRLDMRSQFLRMKPRLFYLLQGRLPGLPRRLIPEADVMVEHPGESGSRLYAGIVESIEFSPNGDLKELVLASCKRYSFRDGAPKLKDVPGDRFVIAGSKIHNINLRYYFVDRKLTGWKKFKYRAYGLMRAFVYEEP